MKDNFCIVIDPQAKSAELLKDHFESHQQAMVVCHVLNSSEAESLMTKGLPSLIVLDVDTDDGRKFCVKLKSDPAFSGVLLCGLSDGWDSNALSATLFQARRADYYLRRPLNPERILDILDGYIVQKDPESLASLLSEAEARHDAVFKQFTEFKARTEEDSLHGQTQNESPFQQALFDSQSALTKSTEQIVELQSRNDSLIEHNSHQKQELVDLRGRVLKTATDTKELTQLFRARIQLNQEKESDYQTQVQQLQTEINQAKSDFVEEQISAERQSLELKELTNKYDSLQAQYDTLLQSQKKAQQSLEETQAQYQELKDHSINNDEDTIAENARQVQSEKYELKIQSLESNLDGELQAVQDLKQELENTKQEIGGLEKAVSDKEGRLEQLRSDLESQSERLKVQEQDIQTLLLDKETVYEQLEERVQTIQKLEEQLESQPDKKEVSQIEEKLSSLLLQNAQLEEDIKGAESKNSDHRRTIYELQENQSALTSQLSEINQVKTGLDAHIIQLGHEKEQIFVELNDIQKSMEVKDKENIELRSEFQTAQTLNSEQLETILSLTKAQSDLQAQYSELVDVRTELHASVERLEVEKEKTLAHLQSIKVELQHIKQREIESTELSNEKTVQNQQKLSELSQAQTDLRSKELAYNTLKEELEGVILELNSEKDLLSESLQSLQNEVLDKESSSKEMMAVQKELVVDIETNAQIKSQLEEKISELQSEIDRQLQSNTSLEESITNSESISEEHLSKIETLTLEQSTLKEQLVEVEMLKSQMKESLFTLALEKEELSNQLLTLQEQQVSLEEKQSDLQSNLERAEQISNEKSTTISSLSDSQLKLETEITLLSESKTELIHQVEKLNKDNQQIIDDLSRVQEQLQHSIESYESRENEIQVQQNQLQNMYIELDEKDHNMDEAKENILRSEQKIQALLSQNDEIDSLNELNHSLQDELQNSNRSIASLKGELEGIHLEQLSQTQEAQNIIDELNSTIESEREFVTEKEGLLEELLDELSNVEESLGQRSQELINSESQISNLKSQLDNSITELTELENFFDSEVKKKETRIGQLNSEKKNIQAENESTKVQLFESEESLALAKSTIQGIEEFLVNKTELLTEAENKISQQELQILIQNQDIVRLESQRAEDKEKVVAQEKETVERDEQLRQLKVNLDKMSHLKGHLEQSKVEQLSLESRLREELNTRGMIEGGLKELEDLLAYSDMETEVLRNEIDEIHAAHLMEIDRIQDAINSERTQLTEDVERATATISEKETELVEMNATIENTLSELKASQEQCKAIQLQLDNGGSLSDGLRSLAEDLKSEVESQQKKLEDAADNRQDLVEQLDALNIINEEQTSQILLQASQVENLESTLVETKQLSEQMRIQAKDLNAEILNQTDKLETASGEHQSLLEQMDALNAINEEQVSQISTQEAKVKELESRLEGAFLSSEEQQLKNLAYLKNQENLELAQEKLDELEPALEAADAYILRSENTISEQKEDIERLKDELEGSQSKILGMLESHSESKDALESKLEDASQTLLQLETELRQSLSDKEALKTDFQSLEESQQLVVAGLNNQIQSLQAELVRQQSELSDSIDRMQESEEASPSDKDIISEALTAKDKELSDKQQALSEISAQFQSLQDEAQSFRSQLEEKASELSQVNSHLQASESRVSNLESKLSEQTESISSTIVEDNESSAFEKELSLELEAATRERDELLSKLEELKDSNQGDESELSLQLEEMRAQLGTLKLERDQAQSEADNAKRIINKQSPESPERQVLAIRAHLDRAEKELDTAIDKSSELKTKVKTIAEELVQSKEREEQLAQLLEEAKSQSISSGMDSPKSVPQGLEKALQTPSDDSEGSEMITQINNQKSEIESLKDELEESDRELYLKGVALNKARMESKALKSQLAELEASSLAAESGDISLEKDALPLEGIDEESQNLIDDLKVKLDNALRNVQEKESERDSVQEENNKKMGTLQALADQLAQDKERLQAELDSLLSKGETQEAEEREKRAKLEADKLAMAQRLADLESNIEQSAQKHEITLKDLNDNKERLENQLEIMEASLSDSQHSQVEINSAIEEDKKELLDKLTQLESKLELSQNQLQAAEESTVSVKSDLESQLKDLTLSLETSQNNHAESLQSLVEEKDALGQKLEAIESNHEAVKATLFEEKSLLEQSIVEMKQSLSDTQYQNEETIECFRVERSTLEGKIEEISKELEGAENNLKQSTESLKVDKENLENELNQIKETLTESQSSQVQSLDLLQMEKEDLHHKLEKVELLLQNSLESTQTSESTITAQSEELDSLRSIIEQQRAENSHIKAQAAKVKEAKDGIAREIDENKVRIVHLIEERDSATQALLGVETKQSNTAIQLQSKEAEVASLLRQNELAQVELNQMNTALARAQAQSTNSMELFELESRLKISEKVARESMVQKHELEAQTTGLTIERDQLKARLNELIEAQFSEGMKYEDLAREKQKLQTELDSKTQEAKTVRDIAERMQAKVNSISESQTGAEAEGQKTSELSAEVAQLKADIESIQSERDSAVQSRLTMLEQFRQLESQATNQEELLALKAELTQKETQIESLKNMGNATSSEHLQQEIDQLKLEQRIAESTKRDILRKAKQLKEKATESVSSLKGELETAHQKIAEMERRLKLLKGEQSVRPESWVQPNSDSTDNENADDFNWDW